MSKYKMWKLIASVSTVLTFISFFASVIIAIWISWKIGATVFLGTILFLIIAYISAFQAVNHAQEEVLNHKSEILNALRDSL